MTRNWRDDAGSLPLAMLIIMVSVSLGTLMTPMILTQVDATRLDGRRVHSLHAAQSGLDVAMAHIRAADDGAGNGVLAELPCGPYTGDVGDAGTARYRVTIAYFRDDPRGKAAAWLAANQMTCYAGAGTASTPSYARLTAEGTDEPTGAFGTVPQRVLVATYIFQTTNQNIPGGLIHVYKTSTSQDLCLDAGTSAPASGADLKVQPCDVTNSAQIWVYNPNLSITLSSSITSALRLGMCIDVAAQTAGTVAKLMPCGDPGTQPRQQWSINDSANLQGTTNGVDLNGSCLVIQNPNTAGSLVVTGNTGCGGPYNNVHTFSAEATVGAGAAGASSGQVVNFSQFGRCMDVTEFNVNIGYLIVWPCKQAPDASKVGWNQKWQMPATGTGRITTTNGTTTYCLRSPGSTAPAQYVTVVVCPASTTPETTWTVNGPTASYATSYIAADYGGRCLVPTDPAVDMYTGGGENISKIVIATCDGSTAQKWNAPPNILRPYPLKDVTER